ncbi:hypothetical protein [Streptomyces sp. MA5143a]|uniref:hypothetical protein n=1 Tax=Streptomyces sp. MA5143a TaxID=2083010 RepID=UPI000D1A4938|nr:hypothetical protein [Streptomyces sp. MA5143a]SPF01823.1 hypothetical protein SMA5143A_2562 [Streptomyces sp. MA5143a]
MPIDLRMSLRRHYTTFLAVLVTGIVLIMAANATAPTAPTVDVYLNCLMSVAGMIATYVLAPPDPSRRGERDQRPGATGDEAR